MKSVFDNWQRIEELLKKKHILLFLDFDGTLTPIAQTPKEAVLSGKTKNLLELLSDNQNYKITIVTGRSYSDIKKIVGVKAVTFVGNHGFEIFGPQINFENTFFPRVRNIYKEIISKLEELFSDLPGVIIEDKGATLSVHYRLVKEKELAWFDEAFHRTVKPFLSFKEIRLRRGKKVYEIRPPVEWDKGKAVLWLLKIYRKDLPGKNTEAVYIGDDETDEDVFLALKNNGITMRVGYSNDSSALYYFKDVDEVGLFLEKLTCLEQK